MAGFVYLARPDRLQNRLLGLALFLDGLNLLMIASRIAANDAGLATASFATQVPLLLATSVAYLAFLGTLQTPLTRVVRGRKAALVMGTGFAVATVAFFAGRALFFEGSLFPGPGPWRWDLPVTRAGGIAFLLLFYASVLVFALVAAVDAWRRRSPGTPARSRAAWYVAAFAVRDVVLLTDWIVLSLHFLRGTTSLHTPWGSVEIVLVPASTVGFCALAAYAILRHQLFGIDLKVKWTVRRGTVVTALAAGFFIVKETIEFLLPIEGLLPSLAGAAAVGLLALPAWRLAGRFADRLMPRVADTEEYRSVRKRELYEAAVESAMKDGMITDRERDMLGMLVERLGLDVAEADVIERTVTRRMGGSA